jgi:hypothetical protein
MNNLFRPFSLSECSAKTNMIILQYFFSYLLESSALTNISEKNDSSHFYAVCDDKS